MRRLSANGVAVHSIFLSPDRASGAHLRRRLASHFAGWFAFAQTDEDGVAKEAVLRPREIGNLGDKLPPHLMDARESQLASEASLSRRRRGQGHLPSAQRLEATVKEGEGLLGHASAEERAIVDQGEPGGRLTRFRMLIFAEAGVAGTMQRFLRLSHPPRTPVRT